MSNAFPEKLIKLNTDVGKWVPVSCWELTRGRLVSRPGRVKDSYPFNTTETGDKRIWTMKMC
mgnify:CR=1 FL=1